LVTVVKKFAQELALARFEATLCLIYHINATLAPHDAIVAMTTSQGFQRVTDFHRTNLDAHAQGLFRRRP
jgi:hypothetical protein